MAVHRRPEPKFYAFSRKKEISDMEEKHWDDIGCRGLLRFGFTVLG